MKIEQCFDSMSDAEIDAIVDDVISKRAALGYVVSDDAKSRIFRDIAAKRAKAEGGDGMGEYIFLTIGHVIRTHEQRAR